MSVWGKSVRVSVATMIVAFLASVPAHAATSCRNIPNPMYPGLQQCVVSVSPSRVEANPPTPQQMAYWCWAASLSMIFTEAGHPISQDNIVLQNYKALVDAPGGDYIHFEQKLNRVYTDDDGNKFRSVATRIDTPDEAADALDADLPILYTTSQHAIVQLSLTYQVAPNGPVVVKGGEAWDPAPGAGFGPMSVSDWKTYRAAWKIEVSDVK